jgi:uncharacterized protein (TIGR02145 family)
MMYIYTDRFLMVFVNWSKGSTTMRKLILTTAAVAAAIAGAFAAEPSFGTFTDARDGQTYKTVKIGKQTWMAENINYKTDSSWCYNDSLSYCKKYGRLYDWRTAKTVCPKGWKLPSREDWNILVQAAGGEKKRDDEGTIHWYGAGKRLKSNSGWNENGNGTVDYGFSALPSGHRMGKDVVNSGGDFDNVGDVGFWWTATEHSDSIAYGRYMNYNDDNADEGYFVKSHGLSVRCVADTP